MNELKLGNDENENLCRPFTEKEIETASFQMEHNKAAGPDNTRKPRGLADGP
jgi:hypothetical protein